MGVILHGYIEKLKEARVPIGKARMALQLAIPSKAWKDKDDTPELLAKAERIFSDLTAPRRR